MRTLPVLPLERGVVLPHMVITVAVESDDAKAAFAAAPDAGDHVLLVPRDRGRYASIGTVAKVETFGDSPDGTVAAVVRGLHRGVVRGGVPGSRGATWVEVELAPDPAPTPRALELAREYRATVEAILEARGRREVADFLRSIDEPGAIADTSGYSPDLSFEQKLEVLVTLDVEQRLEKVTRWARGVLAEVELKERIRNEVAEGMDKHQREFILRQQLDAIRKELGDDDDDVVAEYRRKIDAAGMPEAARAEAERELGRLERMPPQNPEHGWIRTYLDWMVELPWSARTDDRLDVAEARRILDEDHTGLDDVKERIVEHLAVRKLRAERGMGDATGRGSGAILTLVGPPGVGKTSLGESVARALGREFVRMSLGGVRDEAEIRGHRRTYVGALPGRIVRAVKEAGSMNPVILLDEVDKVGSDFRGDPAAALLEVLDPAQNHTFRDHYLELDLDLSDVLFLATANVAEVIPGPLADRMETVRLDGYTEAEKVAIARDHLLPRQIEKAGLEPSDVEFSDVALGMIAAEYTREAGVRQLERGLAKVLRKVAVQLDSGAEAPVHIDADALVGFLGRPRFTPESAERTSVPGVATGLAVTGTGGDVLFIEATAMDGEPGLTLTGQLGDVMKESVSIALSYLRSRGLAGDLASKKLHVHVPAGAVPKDGPSAGITMTTALASLASGRPVRSTVGMTGEVTLQGKVLPIGGVKQKLLAAHRAGLTDVIIPKRNEPDLDDLPESVRAQLRVHPVADVAEALELALEPAPTAHAAAA
ncbi:MAG TPA: endopeptidase La [Actinomycetota bacterium]|nr:endopeptidase La [Actinomycetota bacterium]